MFLVLALHANYYALGWPSYNDLQVNPVQTSTRILLESISIICVNVFIAISGWFSIKVSVKGFSKFIFQCLFFIAGSYIILASCGRVPFDLAGIKHCFFLAPGTVWFVKAYIGLYILAPVLNTFIEKASKSQIEKTLLGFYLFQSIYSFGGAAGYIQYGLSAFTFIGIYLLARYARIYLLNKVSFSQCIMGIFVPMLINAAMFCLSIMMDIEGIRDMCTSFANPLIIISAIACVLLFSMLKVPYNRIINTIAASSFAVYLFHQEPYYIDSVFRDTVRYLYTNFSGLPCLFIILGLLTAVFLISIVLDQPRKWLWRQLSSVI